MNLFNQKKKGEKESRFLKTSSQLRHWLQIKFCIQLSDIVREVLCEKMIHFLNFLSTGKRAGLDHRRPYSRWRVNTTRTSCSGIRSRVVTVNSTTRWSRKVPSLTAVPNQGYNRHCKTKTDKPPSCYSRRPTRTSLTTACRGNWTFAKKWVAAWRFPLLFQRRNINEFDKCLHSILQIIFRFSRPKKRCPARWCCIWYSVR